MAHTSLRIAYDGPALAEGKMDVRDLAPALLAISELCDEAFRVLHGDDKRLRVEVEANFRKGSFGLTLDVVGLWEHIRDLFTGKDGSAVSNLLTILGFTAGTTVGVCKSLIKLVRWLKGQKPSAVFKLGDGTVRVELDGETLIVDEETIRLYADVRVRNALSRVMAPLTKPGIDIFETRDDAEKPLERVVSEEVLSFAPPAVEEDEQEEQLLSRVEERAFGVVGLTFKDGNKWRLSDGDSSVLATIEDQDFLDRIDNREEAFIKGDVLVCQVRFTQFRNATGLHNVYSVLKVLEHKHAARQRTLKFN